MEERQLEPMPPAPDYDLPEERRALGWYTMRDRYEHWLATVGLDEPLPQVEDEDPFADL